MKIYGFSPRGFEGLVVTVEVDLRKGIPSVDIVGLASNTVLESRDRMRTAIRNSNLEFPKERVLINLSPADIKKEGAGFDLAIAIAVLEAKKAISIKEGEEQTSFASSDFDKVLIVGELELSGAVCPVIGVRAALDTALNCGITHCIVPKSNLAEAMEIAGLKVFGASTLLDAYSAMEDESMFETACKENQDVFVPEGTIKINGVEFLPPDPLCDFDQIKNQEQLVRGLQIAAAGGHNVLVFGPPGCGKTLSMKHFGELLPLLTPQEAQSVTRIHSIAGILPQNVPLLRIRPFRAPHQTSSCEGLCGGGHGCMPGEISLAHNGVLFLDEAGEFKATVLQTLRDPLEKGEITLSRAGITTTYPCNFQLLMSSNPCPCGFFGVTDRICTCSAAKVKAYWAKLGGPLKDRMDMRISVSSDGESCLSYTTTQLRQDIATATLIQRKRGKKNSQLSPKEIEEICIMTDEASQRLAEDARHYDLSDRAVASCKKVARTIADMKMQDVISLEHIKEAIDFRKISPGFEN